MGTVNRNRRGGSFRSTEPGRSKDIDWFMDYKIDKYLAHLDAMDNGLYSIEYDEDIPSKEELLEGIDQNNYVDGDGSYRLRQRQRLQIVEEREEHLQEERLENEKEETILLLKSVEYYNQKRAEEEDQYWNAYDAHELKEATRMRFESTEPSNKKKYFTQNEGMTPKLLRSALKKIAEAQEMQLLMELDEEYMKLECLPSEARAHEFQEDAKVNIDKLAKLLRQEGGHMPADEYTYNLELLCQYINRVKYIKKLMVG